MHFSELEVGSMLIERTGRSFFILGIAEEKPPLPHTTQLKICIYLFDLTRNNKTVVWIGLSDAYRPEDEVLLWCSDGSLFPGPHWEYHKLSET